MLATWLIAAAAILICAAMLAVCLSALARQDRDERQAEARIQRIELLVKQNEALHEENVKLARSEQRLKEALRQECDHADECEAQLRRIVEDLKHLQGSVSRADSERVRMEQELNTLRMHCQVSDRENERLHTEKRAQEKLYQSIILEHEDTIAALEAKLQKRAKKRPKPIEDQVTLDDILAI